MYIHWSCTFIFKTVPCGWYSNICMLFMLKLSYISAVIFFSIVMFAIIIKFRNGSRYACVNDAYKLLSLFLLLSVYFIAKCFENAEHVSTGVFKSKSDDSHWWSRGMMESMGVEQMEVGKWRDEWKWLIMSRLIEKIIGDRLMVFTGSMSVDFLDLGGNEVLCC